MRKNPPKAIVIFLKLIIRPELHDSVYGDLIEEYNKDLRKGKFIAGIRLVLASLGFIRYYHLFRNRNTYPKNRKVMIVSTVKTSFRSLLRNKVNTAISILGLVVSFTSAIAIYQYCNFESSYDNFHDDEKKIFRVSHNFKNSSSILRYASTFFAAREDFAEEIPEIVKSTSIINSGGTIKVEDELFRETQILVVTSEFFEIFNFPVVDGSWQEIYKPSSIMLSETTARKYFGKNDPIGKNLEVQGIAGQNWEGVVTAVFKDFPINSHMQADVILPMAKMYEALNSGVAFGPGITLDQVRWRLLGYHTYLEISPNANIEAVTKKANEIVERNRKPFNEQLNQSHWIELQPLVEIHTTTGFESELSPVFDKTLIQLFYSISVLIIAIAWINYINNSTARSVNRAKEVGVRKVLGSFNNQLRSHFLMEGLILNFISLGLSILILLAIYPYLEAIVDKPFFTGISQQYTMVFLLGLIVFSGALLSGFYPAFILARYKPVEVLKGSMRSSSKGVKLRRALVTIQFVFSIFLLGSMFAVQSQMNYMVNHDLGANIERSILVNGPNNVINEPDYFSRMNSLRIELEKIPGVKQVSISGLIPGLRNNWRGSTEQQDDETSGIFMNRSTVDPNYLDLFELQLLTGRNFQKEPNADKESVIVNRLASQLLGYPSPEEAINEYVHFTGNQSFKIVGVIENFYQMGLQFAFEPLVMQKDTANIGGVIVKYEGQNLNNLMTQVESEYKSLFPSSPYQARFISDIFNNQYNAERRFRDLFTFFTIISLVVAIIGLLGLTSYLMNQKLKEISLRKVMGARPVILYFILNKEFLIISLIAFVLATPVLAMAVNEWLANFENRIQLNLVILMAPIGIILSIILLTTLRQTMKVLNLNPAITLRDG